MTNVFVAFYKVPGRLSRYAPTISDVSKIVVYRAILFAKVSSVFAIIAIFYSRRIFDGHDAARRFIVLGRFRTVGSRDGDRCRTGSMRCYQTVLIDRRDRRIAGRPVDKTCVVIRSI